MSHRVQPTNPKHSLPKQRFRYSSQSFLHGSFDMFYVSDAFLETILLEDIPYGDATSSLLGIESVSGAIDCYPKADCVVSGVTLAQRLFEKVGLVCERFVEDGARVSARQVVLRAAGSAGAIHAVYKTAQNIMEYCSGISSRARAMVEAARSVNPTCCVVTTRKHFPGTKTLSLYAAQAGGALVHRTGLSESILIFDQHRVFTKASVMDDLIAIRSRDPERKVCIEAGDPAEAIRFVEAGADIVQCERFSPDALSEFVGKAKVLRPQVLISAAGGVNADNARAYAAAGADFLVTTWPYFGRPVDIKMSISRK